MAATSATDDALANLLAAGDVDAVRRSLQAQLGIATTAARPLEPPPRRLHASAPAMRISVRGRNFALVGERTMGKVSWPAGHALADWILERGDAAGDAPPEATLVEVGAGCGLPALAAAALGRAAGWSCVAATDFVEHAVELLRENVVRNAAQIHVARLDAVEGGVAALSAVIDEAETAAAAAPPPRELWIVAADIHYHEAVVAALLAAAAGVARARPSRRVRVVLARSSNFEHCDAAVERAAAECGLRLVRRHVRRAAGVLDAIGLDGGAAYVGCDDDVSDLFEYEVEAAEAAEAAAVQEEVEEEVVEEEVVEAQFEPFMPSLPGGAIELATCDLAPLLSLEEIGSRVWPAAVRLVQELQTPTWRERLRASRACVELGSGTGAVGLAASVLGAATVVLTDLPELLETCERNAARNAARAAGTVTCAPLAWGEADAAEPAGDLVLMSDCVNSIYGVGIGRRLATTLGRILRKAPSPRDAVGLWAQTFRGEATAEREFLRSCADLGLALRELPRRAPPDLAPTSRGVYATPTDADDLAEQAATCRVFEVRVAR